MRKEFRPGDRVRVTRRCRVPTYHDGEGGTVADGPYPYPSGAVHYLVALDRGGPDATPTLFLADEIEADEDGTCPAAPGRILSDLVTTLTHRLPNGET